MAAAGQLAISLFGLWGLTAAVAASHYLGLKRSPQFLRLVLGGLIGAGIWRAGLFQSLLLDLPLLPGVHLPLAPRLLSPALYFAVIVVYVVEGAAPAAMLILGLLSVALLVTALSPINLVLASVLGRANLGPLESLLPMVSWRQHLAQFLAFVVGVYLVVVLYQWLANRLPPSFSWAAALAALGAGWVEGGLFAFGAFWGSPGWARLLAAEFSGWTLAGLALIPPLAVYLHRLRVEGWIPAQPAERRPGEVLRTTLDFQAALERSEERAAGLDENLRLLTEVRRVIVRAEDPEQLMQGVCKMVAGAGPYRMAWIGVAREGKAEVDVAARAGAGADFLEVARFARDDGVSGGLPLGSALWDHRSACVEDIAADPAYAPWRQAALARGFRSEAAFPIRLGERSNAALVVYAERAAAFSPRELRLLQAVADDLAYGAGRLYSERQRALRIDQLAHLNELTRAALSIRDLDELFPLLAEHMGALLHADACYIALWDERAGAPVLSAASGPLRARLEQISAELDSSRVGRTITEVVLEAREPLILEAGASLPDQLSPVLARGLSEFSLLAIPLNVGEVGLGSAGFTFQGRHRFSEEEIALGEQAGGLAALAIANLRAYQAERRRRAELETLRQASLKLTSSLEMQPILDAILQDALRLTGSDDAHIFLYDGEVLTFGSALWAGGVQRKPFSEPRPNGITYAVARSEERIVVDDASSHELFADAPWPGSIVGLPLRVGDRVRGVMNVAFQSPRRLDEDELRVLELLADQAAIAIENTRLYASSVAERRRIHLLYDVTRELGASLDRDAILARAVERTVENLGGLFGYAALLEEGGDRMQRQGVAGLDAGDLETLDDAPELRVGQGVVGWVAQTRQAVNVADVTVDARWIPAPGFEESIRSALCAPILLGSRLLGVLAVFHRAVGAFGPEHLDLLLAISGQIGLALSNAEQYRQVERRLAELTAIQQVAQAVNRRLELQPLLEDVVQHVRAVLGYPVVNIDLVEGDHLVLGAAAGVERVGKLEIDLSEGIVGRAARTNRPVFVPDVSLDADFVELVPGVRSEIAVPLRKGGVVIGVLNVESPEPSGLTQDDLRLLTLLADQVSVAIENAALYDRLRRHTEELEKTVAARTSQLAEALEKAHQADRVKTQFISDVSHELRTPLSNIRLYLDLLAEGRPERFSEYLKTLDRESARLVSLIEDLLAFSRFDAGALSIEKRPLDLNTLALSLVEDRRRLFAERNIELTFLPHQDLPFVLADHRLVSQVIANLMTNAMHYTPAGGKVTVSTRGEEAEGEAWATLSVQDTGTGIPEEEQKRLFERFFRGSASRAMRNPGTGLGLAICKEILQQHGGRIQVASRVGEGSTFTFWLPAAEVDLSGLSRQRAIDFEGQSRSSAP